MKDGGKVMIASLGAYLLAGETAKKVAPESVSAIDKKLAGQINPEPKPSIWEDRGLKYSDGGPVGSSDKRTHLEHRLWNERGYDYKYLNSLSLKELNSLYDTEFYYSTPAFNVLSRGYFQVDNEEQFCKDGTQFQDISRYGNNYTFRQTLNNRKYFK
jgi:hypothetical protein